MGREGGREERRKEPAYSRCVIGTDGRIYIRIITAIRHMGEAYIRVYIDSSMPLYLSSSLSLSLSLSLAVFRFTLRRNVSRARARAKITDGKLDSRPLRRRILAFVKEKVAEEAKPELSRKLAASLRRACGEISEGEKSSVPFTLAKTHVAFRDRLIFSEKSY